MTQLCTVVKTDMSKLENTHRLFKPWIKLENVEYVANYPGSETRKMLKNFLSRNFDKSKIDTALLSVPKFSNFFLGLP